MLSWVLRILRFGAGRIEYRFLPIKESSGRKVRRDKLYADANKLQKKPKSANFIK
jgi:hypothetical protein